MSMLACFVLFVLAIVFFVIAVNGVVILFDEFGFLGFLCWLPVAFSLFYVGFALIVEVIEGCK